MNIIEGNDREDDGVVNDDDGENRYDVEKMDMICWWRMRRWRCGDDGYEEDTDKEDEEEDDDEDKYGDFALLTLIWEVFLIADFHILLFFSIRVLNGPFYFSWILVCRVFLSVTFGDKLRLYHNGVIIQTNKENIQGSLVF